MSQRSSGGVILLLVLIAAGAWAVSVAAMVGQRRAERASTALLELVARQTAGESQLDVAPMVEAAETDLAAGRYREAAALLAPRPLSRTQREEAERFLAGEATIGARVVRLVGEAQRRQAEGTDVTPLRRVLSAALRAASAVDGPRVASLLSIAEAMLEPPLPGAENVGSHTGRDGILRQLAAIEPAVVLGRETLLEGMPAVEMILARAAWCFHEQDYGEASRLISLAGQLLGAPRRDELGAAPAAEDEPQGRSAGDAAGEPPQWFSAQAAPPAETAAEEAGAIVRFCKTVAQTRQLSPPVRWMAERAAGEQRAGNHTTARWWALVALEAMGMSPDAVAAGIDAQKQVSEGSVLEVAPLGAASAGAEGSAAVSDDAEAAHDE